MKNFLKNILLSILTLLFIFFIFETALRLFWRMSALEGEVYTTSRNYNLRYELKPAAQSGFIKINADGFRDKDYPFVKSNGLTRLIMIGDSETFGKALPLEDTIAKKLQDALKEKCPARSFEVFNMGVEGYNTIQEYEFLKTKSLKYDPDIVILYYSFNDPDYPEYYFAKNFFNRNFASVRYIQYRMKKFLVKRDRKLKGIKNEAENFRYLYNSPSWKYTREAILGIKDFAHEHNLEFVLALVPEISSLVGNFSDAYPYLYLNRLLNDFCAQNNIEVIDPLEYLRSSNIDPMSLAISASDRHKNAQGNTILGEYIAGELIKKKIIYCD